VNAQVLAEEKGIKLGTKTGAPEAGFETSIGVKVDTAHGRVRVTGALMAAATAGSSGSTTITSMSCPMAGCW